MWGGKTYHSVEIIQPKVRQSGTGAGKQDVNKCHGTIDFLRDMLKQVESCYDAIHQLSNIELVSGKLVCFEHSHCQNVRSQS